MSLEVAVTPISGKEIANVSAADLSASSFELSVPDTEICVLVEVILASSALMGLFSIHQFGQHGLQVYPRADA